MDASLVILFLQRKIASAEGGGPSTAVLKYISSLYLILRLLRGLFIACASKLYEVVVLCLYTVNLRGASPLTRKLFFRSTMHGTTLCHQTRCSPCLLPTTYSRVQTGVGACATGELAPNEGVKSIPLLLHQRSPDASNEMDRWCPCQQVSFALFGDFFRVYLARGK
jgi:hypothetical protein